MPTYPEYQQQLAQDLVTCISSSSQAPRSLTPAANTTNTNDLKTLVDTLVNAMPYFGNMAMEAVHRAALTNLMAVNFPTNSISPHPNESGPWYAYYNSSYSYKGPYAGYRDAFFHGIPKSSLAGVVAAQVQAANNALNAGWWGNFGVTLLTDAIRQQISISLDGGKLSGDLNNYNVVFRTGLTASYLATLTNGFTDTANAFAAIQSGGQLKDAANLLDQAIVNGQFTANINRAIGMGGDSTNAATWFLYNLWVMLKALGSADVDGAIKRFQAAGLQVPAEVQAGNWWTGGYSSWFPALSGADIKNLAAGMISASMPEEEMTCFPSSPYPCIQNVNESNGYSMSLTQWGPLNWYLPHDSGCCFADGTMVLMADGSSQAIETIAIGDKVATDLGPRSVALVEKPPRGTRTLYHFNHLSFQATGAHPFRNATEDGAKYAAIEPWTLIDGVPTITASGVTPLQPGVVLAARRGTQPTTLTVEQIQIAPGRPEEAAALVYDLLLEGWEQEHTLYYVGGPEVFVGVEAESIDPTQTMAVTNAIITAMEIITPAARQHLGNPHVEVPRLLRRVDHHQIHTLARRASRAYHGGKPLKAAPRLGIECMIQQGDWDLHASALEYYLASDFGRAIRTTAANGWRIAPDGTPDGDRLGRTLRPRIDRRSPHRRTNAHPPTLPPQHELRRIADTARATPQGEQRPHLESPDRSMH